MLKSREENQVLQAVVLKKRIGQCRDAQNLRDLLDRKGGITTSGPLDAGRWTESSKSLTEKTR